MTSANQWEAFIREGDKYLRAAANGRRRREVFTNDLLYNIIAMAIEKHCMGLFLYHRKMPENHTLGSLISDAAKIADLPAGLVQKVLAMDQFQEICVLDTYQRRIPTDEDITEMLSIGEAVKTLVAQQTSQPPPG